MKNTFSDIKNIKDKFKKINNCRGRNFFVIEQKDDDYPSHVIFYKENFDNFEVCYKKIDERGDYERTELSFIDTSKNINFTFNFRTHDKYLSDYDNSTFFVSVEKNSITDNEIISNIVEKCGVESYLDKLLNRVEILDMAEDAQMEIERTVNSKYTALKAAELIAKLSNEELPKSMQFSTSPFEENGYKAWINSENKLHNEDGPAILSYKGKDFWFKNDEAYLPEGKQIVQYSEDHFREYDNGILVKDSGKMDVLKIEKPSIEIQEIVEPPPIEQHGIVKNVLIKFRDMFSPNEHKNKNKL